MNCVDFFRRVLRVRPTVGQSAFVAVAVDGILPRDLEGPARDAALAIFGDVSELSPLARRTVVAAMGRDSGKTHLGAGIAIYKLVTCNLDRLGPGDVGTVAIVAPREKTARVALRRAVALVRRAPELARLLVGEPRRDGFSLRRPDGYVVSLEVFAASRGGASLRGPSWIAVIFDEAAQFRDASAAVNDEELYRAVMPRVLPNGLVLFLSTPWSEEGLFWTLASTNLNNPTTAVVAKASTLIMRDHDPAIAASIEVERQRDPDNALREFDAEFMATGGSLFFDARSIEDAIDDDLHLPVSKLLDREKGAAGADIGLVRDASALVSVGARSISGATMLRVLSLIERKPEKGKPLKLSTVIADFAGELRRYGISSFVADGHAREPAREWAEAEKIEIEARPEGPNAVFDTFVSLRQAFTDRRIRLPRHPRLLAQLRAVTVKPAAGGRWQVIQPRRAGNSHGDIVSALVLGVWSTERTQRQDFSYWISDGSARSRGDDRDPYLVDFIRRRHGLPTE